jgi:hypothetical protein
MIATLAGRQTHGEIERDPAKAARLFIVARQKVTVHLGIAGGAVALLVLAAGAMRLALEASGFGAAWDANAQLGLGVLGAAVLAATFLPVFVALGSWGWRVAGALAKAEAPAGGESWSEQRRRTADLAAAVGVSGDLWSTFKAAVPIAGPILAALVARLFES